MVCYATIGTNFVVTWFVEAAKKSGKLDYGITYSRKKETALAFSEKYGSREICTNLEEIAKKKDIDAVYIASPNSFHFSQAKQMLENGKHVLCEKTVTNNEKELLELLEIAERNELIFMEAMRSVHSPGFQKIEEKLPELGTIRRASFQYCQYSSRYDKFKNGIVENAFNPIFSNGALTDIGVYCVHPMVKLFGYPKEITAQALKLSNGVDGQGTILAAYEGMQAEMLYSKISDSKIPSQIQGEKGTMVIKEIPKPEDVTIYYRDGRVEKLEIPQTDNNLVFEAEEWANLIEGVKKGGEEKEKALMRAKEHNKASLLSIKLMDEVRRQQGIVWECEK